MPFDKDLDFGKDAEHRVLKLIQKKYPLAHAVEGKVKAYDIFVPEQEMGVEVKSDRQADETGNCFLEVSCNGELSGLCASRAKLWVYCTKSSTYWLQRQAIINMILTCEEKRMFHKEPKGETSKVIGYLIPMRYVESICMTRESKQC